MLVAAGSMMGGFLARRQQAHRSSQDIMRQGMKIIFIITTSFSLISIINHTINPFPAQVMIFIAILSQMIIACGICMTTSQALAVALVDYQYAIGTASSLFGFFYYVVISALTMGMGMLHNGTLLPMPLYFLSLSCLMIFVNHVCIKNRISIRLP